MRKNANILVIFVLIFSLLLTGCGGEEGVSSADDKYMYEVPFEDYKLKKYIEVPEVSKIEYEKPVVEVTEEEVDDEIQVILKEAAIKTQITEGTVADGDEIFISYSAECDGQKMAANDGYAITIGKEYLTAELEDKLIGQEIGSTVIAETVVADDFEYDESLAGKKVVYEINIKHKIKTDIPELNDQFIKENSGCETLAEYREFVKQNLYDKKYGEAIDEIFNEKWNEIIDSAIVKDYPEDEMEIEKQFFQKYMFNQGVELASEDMLSVAEEYAKEAVKEKMVLFVIGDREDLIPNEKEFRIYLKDYLASINKTEEEFKETFYFSIFDYAVNSDWVSEYVLNEVKSFLMDLE